MSSYVLYRYHELLKSFSNISEEIYYDYLFILDLTNKAKSYITELNKNYLNIMQNNSYSYEGLKPRNQIEFF